ncbi:beta-glucosidase BglX [Flavobacterium cupreum]|uniref:beta-glucosidase n=2 Tax=Flavobacterium TaxID=237 RepID=A0A4Y7UDH0_9FLAO|nr:MULTISPECIES: beta-glucosidase BglX [Flavobacterium]RUT68000.1 beta-glucosidase BglX [Flavobacterium cupreum]TCN59028.1 beta-glucosidase [Flavobacterium circumlabens]TEB44426.1 beta-glucosidase BglX [Flavobacterium circumlabens]
MKKNNQAKVKISKIVLLFTFSVGVITAQNTSTMDKKVNALIQKMTLEEKVGQLNLATFVNENNTTNSLSEMIKRGEIGSILKSNGAEKNLQLQKIAVEQSRLGIPIMFQEDVIHGYKTIFPSPLGEAAGWNLETIEKSASIAAKEASASGIHLTYAPMVDISNDPRWGRIVEGAGEDPFYASLVASARVKGFQGNDLASGQNVMACVKHFAGYGAALAGRDYNIADFSERTLREIYLPPFRAAINSGVGSVMAAYSAYDGIPATANQKLLKDILRKELGFNGMLITDWETVRNLVKIGTAANEKEAVLQSINAGVDVDMTSGLFLKHIKELVQEGKINVDVIDQAVKRVLIAKYKLGLFDDPYRFFDLKREKETLMNAEHLEFARKAARECMVLLKNENQLLPLNKNIKKIAVIGPLANRKKDLLSWWGGNYSQWKPEEVVSILDGLKKSVDSSVEIKYAEGVKLDGFEAKGLELIPEAVKLALESDVVILVVGEEFSMSGEAGSISNINLPGAQEELVNAIAKIGKPLVTVLLNGRPFDIQNVNTKSNAVLEAWQPGTMGGLAVADILLGKYNPSGKLTVSFPRNTGQIPIYYNYKRTSHDVNETNKTVRWTNKYLDIPTTPLFPFGYGLSYTEFSYSNLKLSSSAINPNQSVNVSVEVSNTGKADGEEVIQLYVGDDVSSVARPAKELKEYAKISLKKGEKKTVNFILTPTDFSFYNKEMKWVLEPGSFSIMIGASSADIKFTEKLSIQ